MDTCIRFTRRAVIGADEDEGFGGFHFRSGACRQFCDRNLRTDATWSLIHALDTTWRCIVKRLNRDWKEAMMIPSRVWEEMIAAAFDQEGYDEVILTPQSGDHGRDVIAIRRGIGCVRIIGSVKAYKPGHLVTHDDVRALAGVLYGDPKASKGIITTTSDFAPRIGTDPYIAPLMPFRLELTNGSALQSWLSKVAGLNRST